MRIVLVHAESNAVYRCVRLVVDQFQFDMFQVFPYQLAGPVILDSERAEYGLLVVRAERIHLFQLTHELGVDILQVQHGIYIDLRRHLFGDDLVGGQLEEPLGESVQVFLFQGEAGGIRVATEVFQQVAAAFDCFVYVESRDRASGTSDQFGRFRQDDCRAVVFFRQAGSDDADHPFVPSRIVDDDRLTVFHVLEFVDDGVRLVCNLLVQFAAFFVILVDALALFAGHVDILRQEQFDRFLSVHHTAGSVDARSDLEDDVADRDLFARQAADIDDPFQAEARIAVKLLQAVVSQYAVFAGDGDDVRGDADRRQLQQFLQVGKREVVAFGECLHELEPDAASRQMFVRIDRVHPLGIQYGDGIGQCVVRHVMVADNKIDPQLLGIFDLFDGLDAAVERDH